jgi:hypothetical protein
MQRRLLSLVSFLCLFLNVAMAVAAPNTGAEKLSYPELEVTPRASERLEIEAKGEARTHWLTLAPLQASALATLYVGLSANYDSGLSSDAQSNYNMTKKFAVGVGAGWLALTTALSAYYRPYYAGYKDVSKMPTTNSREELTRERIAEEALYAPDAVAQKLKWFSVASNLGVNLALVSNADRDSRLKISAGVLAAFAPLIFESRWSQVAMQHREYKKKIYGPISFSSAYSTILATSNSSGAQKWQPGLGLLWTF